MQALIVLASLIVPLAMVAALQAPETAAVRAASNCETKDTGNYLYDFSCGSLSEENGTAVRKFSLIVEEDRQIPITLSNNSMNTIYFPAWTFNGTIPAPTMRMNEGDLVHITVISAPENKHHHSLHMHSVHSPDMDGTSGPSGDIAPGESFTYVFTAGPAGLYPFHCHFEPVQDHINRGLYGAMIIDPPNGRPAANEMVMLMNGYDLDINPDMIPTARPPNAAEGNQILYPTQATEEQEAAPENEEQAVESGDDAESAEAATRPELELERDNEIYTVNSKAFEYMNDPIEIKLNEPVRIYLVNMVEFDPVNSFHLHAGMFNYTASATEGTPPTVTDIVTLGQGDRGMIEFTPKHLGNMMIHAHVNEFTNLGWMGSFEVVTE